MGWYGQYDTTIGEMVKQLTDPQEWEYEGHRLATRTIRHTLVGMNLWSVTENIRDGEVIDRYIRLDLLRRGTDGEIAHKPLSETMGPAEVNCPLAYLDLVPEPNQEWARDWRQRVRRYHAERKAQHAAFASLKVGDPVTLGSRYKQVPGLTVSRISKHPRTGRRQVIAGGYRITPKVLAVPEVPA